MRLGAGGRYTAYGTYYAIPSVDTPHECPWGGSFAKPISGEDLAKENSCYNYLYVRRTYVPRAVVTRLDCTTARLCIGLFLSSPYCLEQLEWLVGGSFTCSDNKLRTLTRPVSVAIGLSTIARAATHPTWPRATSASRSKVHSPQDRRAM